MNNKKTSGTVIQSFAAAWLITLTLFALSFALNINVPAIVQYLLGALIIVIAIVFARGGFHYIEIDTEDDLFRIKHFNLFPMGREYKRIQIEWARYHSFEVRELMGGLFKFLYVYEQTARGVARYPAVGLSALKKNEQESILNFFKKMEK